MEKRLPGLAAVDHHGKERAGGQLFQKKLPFALESELGVKEVIIIIFWCLDFWINGITNF